MTLMTYSGKGIKAESLGNATAISGQESNRAQLVSLSLAR